MTTTLKPSTKPQIIAVHDVPGTGWFIALTREHGKYGVARGTNFPGIGERFLTFARFATEDDARQAANAEWLVIRKVAA